MEKRHLRLGGNFENRKNEKDSFSVSGKEITFTPASGEEGGKEPDFTGYPAIYGCRSTRRGEEGKKMTSNSLGGPAARSGDWGRNVKGSLRSPQISV